MRAQVVHPLDLSAGRALAQGVHVLQCLARHLPVPLLHMRCLLLGHRLEDRLPDIFKNGW
jgi:hypothetical protein